MMARVMRWLLLGSVLVMLFAAMPRDLASEAGSAQEPSLSRFTGTWLPSGLQARITLAVNGSTVSGTVGIGGTEAPIIRGKVIGESIEFAVDSPDGQRTVTFQASFAGVDLRFSRSVSVRNGGTEGGTGIFGVAGPAA